MATSSDPFAAFSTPAPALPESGAAAITTAKQNVPDLFAAFHRQNAAQAVPPAQNPATPAAPKTDDLFSAFGASGTTAISKPEVADTLKASPSSGNDLFSAFSTNPTQKAPSESEVPESSTWYGKSWDWLNKPLLDLHREGAGGFEAGAEDVLSGLTSPLSIALTVGTLGSGTALRALGLTAKELPVAIQGLKFQN